MKKNQTLLDRQITEALKEVLQTVRQFPWENRYHYAAWLAQTHYFVRHTTNLLALKAARYTPAQPEKHRAALVHLREETGHDVMALRDMKTLGYELSKFPEKMETSLFYQMQYYFIDQHGPAAFNGYSLFLEEMAVREGAGVGKKIVEAHGKEAASFLLLHSKADIEHTELQQAELNGATPELLAAVLQNLKQSAYLYNGMLKKIMAEAEKETGADSELKSRPRKAA